MVIVWDLFYSLSESDFRISLYESYDDSSNFAECQYFTRFKWPYFGIAWCFSHMVVHAASLHVLCMLIWPWSHPRSTSRSRGFWASNNYLSPACCRRWAQPPCGAFWFLEIYSRLWCVYVCGEKVCAVHVYICGVQDVDVENEASLNVNDYRQPLTQVSRALSH